jgi:protein-serine/threonine kinase
MDWFRNKSLAKSADAPVPPSIPVFDRPLPPFPPAEDPTTPTMQTYKDVSSTSTVNVPPKVVVTTPGPQDQGSWSAQMSPTPSASHSAETSHSAPVKLRAPASAPAPQIIAHGGQRGIFIPNGAVARPQFNKALIKVHRGAVDQGTITIGSPPEVFASVTKVLKDMGIQIHSETDFKYRCVRPKRGKTNLGTTRDSSLPGNALTAYTMVGSAGSGGVSCVLCQVDMSH